MADSLAKGWIRNGEDEEDAELTSYCNCEDVKVQSAILDYLEEIEG
jgi:hypothetical protein